MEWQDRLRATILTTITRDIPMGFWADVRERARQAYLDVFHNVNTDPNLIRQQRLDRLYQDRHFRMEHLLSALAHDHGLACSPTMLAENNCHYVYITGGLIGMTQAYVPAIGSMPQPARYREKLAAMSGIPRVSRLDLGDEPKEVLIGKDFYGLLAHNPVGKRFSEDEQKLGMLQFCVPTNDCKVWAAQLAMEEILAGYPVDKREIQPDRKPEWKTEDKKDQDAS